MGWGSGGVWPLFCLNPLERSLPGSSQPGSVLESDAWCLLYLKQTGFSEDGPQWWGPGCGEGRDRWDLGELGRLFWISSQKQVRLVLFGAHSEPVSGLLCGCLGLQG